ncbi:MAG TPA: hypothetical protein VGV85_02545 [Longimicrobiaceae bacterium]|nr:hypothetical protein [Longimicrobiaceae bacterium]
MLRWLSLFMLVLAAACDPCAGIGTCVEPQLRYTGVVTSLLPDYPAREVRVEFVRRSGVGLADTRITAVSDSAGVFVLEGRAQAEGTVTGDLVFYPPSPIAPVTIGGVEMSTARAPGELRRLGTWRIEYPFFAYKGVLFHRNNGQPPARGIEVEFRRTGGIPVFPDTFTVVADSLGRFDLKPKSTVTGEVTGDLAVRLLPPFQPYVIRGIRLSTMTIPRLDSLIPVPIGYGLPYTALLTWESTGKPAAGVEVELRRTGGVRIHPQPYVVRADAFGTVLLSPAPLESGELVADVVVRLPQPRGEAVIVRGLRLRTVEDARPTQFVGFFRVPGGPDA